MKAKTNKNAIIYDKNPRGNKNILANENVEIIGEIISDIYIPVRYNGFNYILKIEDLNLYEN